MIEYAFERGEVVDFGNEDTKVFDIKRSYNQTSFNVSVNKSDTLVLPLLYYCGYNVTLDRQSIPFRESSNGLIEVPIEKSGTIRAYYDGTTVQEVSFYISLLGSISLIVFIFTRNRKNRNELYK